MVTPLLSLPESSLAAGAHEFIVPDMPPECGAVLVSLSRVDWPVGDGILDVKLHGDMGDAQWRQLGSLTAHGGNVIGRDGKVRDATIMLLTWPKNLVGDTLVPLVPRAVKVVIEARAPLRTAIVIEARP